MTRYVPHTERFGPWVTAYDTATADLVARHEQHKAGLSALDERLAKWSDRT